MLSFRDELRAAGQSSIHRVSLVRGDAKDDAYAIVKQRRGHDSGLPDHTTRFLKAIKHEIPTAGEVIFQGIPIFASQGDGKTITALTICFELLKHYGPEKVSVNISNHIPSLADAMRDRATPVQILFVDDALKFYNSRGGGSKELIEAIGDFNTLRHKMEEAQNTLNGIVFCIFTVQMFKGLDKTFRGGFPIFKSALVEDKDDIISATRMSKAAWDYLFQILRQVKVAHQKHRKSDSIVCLPGYEAGRLHLPMWEHDRVNDILDMLGTAEAKAMKAEKHVAPKYKFIEKHWTIKRRTLTKEEEMVRLSQVMDLLAARFAKDNEEDPSTNEGKAALRAWLDSIAIGQGGAAVDQLHIEDYWEITKVPRNLKSLQEKVVTARKKLALQRTGIVGEGGMGGMTKDQLLDFVASKWLDSGRSTQKEDKATFHSWLYKLDHSYQNEAVAERTAIWSRIEALAQSGQWVYRGDAQKAKNGSDSVALKELPETVVLDGEYFEVDDQLELDRLIEEARAKANTKLLRQLIVFKTCHLGDTFGGKDIGSPTAMANTEEGRQWQREELDGLLKDGEPASRPTLNKDEIAGKSHYGNHVGALYEVWVEQKIRAGYIVPGILDRGLKVLDVRRMGGNSHDPDIVILYEGGVKDYVSLKCYNTGEPFNITTSAGPSDEIQPERKALAEDERKGIAGNRVVVLAVNRGHKGLQAAWRFNHTNEIPSTLSVNKGSIGKRPWLLPGTVRDSPRASKPADAVPEGA